MNKKNIEQSLELRKKRKINWIEVDEVAEWAGHGIEIYHEDVRGGVMAFIKGYGRVGKYRKEITVYVIKSDSELFSKNEIDGQEIVDEVREYVTRFLTGIGNKNDQKTDKRPSKIKKWFNG